MDVNQKRNALHIQKTPPNYMPIKFRPILFSTPMIQAIKSGLKSITRRSIKIDPKEWEFHRIHIDENGTFALFKNIKSGGALKWVRCRFGNVGDGLWVKETFAHKKIHEEPPGNNYHYKADDEFANVKWKSSMFMPRVASRFKFEITGLKVERAHDISTEDILKEGVRIPVSSDGKVLYEIGINHSPLSFILKDRKPTEDEILFAHWQSLWMQINSEESWNKNPYCWCISFKEA